MNIESLYKWGKIKGVNIIGTGDFTHPEWFRQLREKLEPAESGLFKLKEEYAKEIDNKLPNSIKNNLMRFILTVEISNIYSKYEKVRKVHHLVLAPSFEVVSEINFRLNKIGNLNADGRPILGLDSKDLLKNILAASSDAYLIPAHIWTPWFSMFGSKSGFDSIEETFEELSEYIFAIETGLSSDPYMNWRLSQLDGITLLSHSDAHSPAKLGREADIVNCDLSYFEILDAIKKGDERFIGTIEFFPEGGKYHYDGHRLCNIRLEPNETKKYNGICPKCGKPLVIGVLNRVEQLADRPSNFKPEKHKTVEYIIPLVEILAEIKGVKSPNSNIIQSAYERIYSNLGTEFDILRKIKIEDIKDSSINELSLAISKLRKGNVYTEPGYDGVYGVIKVFKNKNELKKSTGQVGMNI